MNNEVTIVTEELVALAESVVPSYDRSHVVNVIGAWSDWGKANAEAEKLRKKKREDGALAIYETVTLVIDEGER